MRSRWIGWAVAACALAVAIPVERAAADSSTAPKAKARGKARAKAAARAKSPGKHGKHAPKPVPPRKPTLDQELAQLADDPLLARADKIEGKEVKGLVAFTFDDGPNPETTPAVLEALQKYNVPATFFIVTRRISGRLGEKNREVLGKVLAAGFNVASHTVSHVNLRGVSTRSIKHEIDQSLRVLSKQAGRTIGMFRPPFGAIDRRGRAHLKKRGLTEVRWSIDTVDWRLKDAEELRTRTLATILKQDGGVVLMHDVKEVTAKTIARVLDDLEAANCQRLADKKPPILPVSLHYWLRDKGRPRAIPEDVKKRTDAYRSALPGRCAARAKSPESKPDSKSEAAPEPKLAHAKIEPAPAGDVPVVAPPAGSGTVPATPAVAVPAVAVPAVAVPAAPASAKP